VFWCHGVAHYTQIEYYRQGPDPMRKHPSHKTRFSDASSYDEICIYCGATDLVPGGWGELAYPCPGWTCRAERPHGRCGNRNAPDTERCGACDADRPTR
jgi:hypothetical protein